MSPPDSEEIEPEPSDLGPADAEEPDVEEDEAVQADSEEPEPQEAGPEEPGRKRRPVRRSVGWAVGAGRGAWGFAASRRYARTAPGRARKAYERGDSIFQHKEKIGRKDHGELLSAIESEGWTLSETHHVEERRPLPTTEEAEYETVPYAIYTFRRAA